MDRGEYASDEPGVVTLIWDNSYSVLTSREVHLRIAVLRKIFQCEVTCVDPNQEAIESEVNEASEQVNEQVNEVSEQVNEVSEVNEVNEEILEKEEELIIGEIEEFANEDVEGEMGVMDIPEDVINQMNE